VTYAGSKTAVVVDLSGAADTARQGKETDTLTGIEGAIGSDAGDQAFRFVGTAALTAAPGEVGWYSSGGNTIVRGSVDADAQAEFEIQLTGAVPLSVLDFYL
jgi:hypothetical protein